MTLEQGMHDFADAWLHYGVALGRSLPGEALAQHRERAMYAMGCMLARAGGLRDEMPAEASAALVFWLDGDAS